VLCHLEDADGTSLYLCSAANRILINPAGGVRFAGLRTRHLYYASLLDKLGIRAEFVRIGDHKSAPEGFVRDRSTEVSRADKIDLLQQHERQFVEGIASGRSLPAGALRERFLRGPFIASEARQAGLVDGYAWDDQLEEEAGKLVGHDVLLLDDERAPRAPRAFGTGPGIAVVYIDGDMVDGRSRTIPFLGMKLAGSYTIAEALKEAREDPMTAAVVLRVETGGGSAMAAEVMWREVMLTARRKPVVVSMGTSAASAGYYISAPGTRIFANPLTLTGSIGIFYGKADVAELLRKIGVSVEVFKTAPRADAESIFRPFSPDERQELRKKVGQFYDVFLSRVALGRKLSKGQVHEVAQGRVWTGEQALERKLVDELGGLRQAMEHARKLAGLPLHAPVTELPPPDTTLLGRILGIEGLREEASVLPVQIDELLRALGPFLVHSADKPLARMELVSIGR
jgi:protease-4